MDTRWTKGDAAPSLVLGLPQRGNRCPPGSWRRHLPHTAPMENPPACSYAWNVETLTHKEPLLIVSRELPSAAPGDIISAWFVCCQHHPALPQGFWVLWALGAILGSRQLVGIPWGSCSRSVNPHKPIIHVNPLSLMPFPMSR